VGVVIASRKKSLWRPATAHQNRYVAPIRFLGIRGYIDLHAAPPSTKGQRRCCYWSTTKKDANGRYAPHLISL
jgi:hypothetical protein